MSSAQRIASVVASAAIVVGLAGCSLLEPKGTEVELTGIEACALGNTWSLDMTAFAATVKANIAAQGVAVTDVVPNGSQKMTWDLDGVVVIVSDFTLTSTAVPAEGQTQTVVTTHKGKATGESFINGSVAIPRNWDGTGVIVKSTADLNGEPLDPVPFTIVNADLDDSVGVELTCDAGTLTTHQRGEPVVLTWKKS